MERLFTAWLTSTDRVDHAVTDEEFTEHRPEPEAVCGAVIMLAPMETPPGPHCARCMAFLAAWESLRDLDQLPRALPTWHLPPNGKRMWHWLVRVGQLCTARFICLGCQPHLVGLIRGLLSSAAPYTHRYSAGRPPPSTTRRAVVRDSPASRW